MKHGGALGIDKEEKGEVEVMGTRSTMEKGEVEVMGTRSTIELRHK